jgi:hypothetical protein
LTSVYRFDILKVWNGSEIKKSGRTKMKNSEIKITKAGYLYINGVKASEKRITPLQRVVADITKDQQMIVDKWIAKNYRMV